MSSLALWPGALDVGEHGPDLRVAEDIPKPGHVALVSAADDGCSAFPDDPEQDVIGMVPRVAARVVRWRWQTAGGKGRSPVRLPFQFRSMTCGAVIRVSPPPIT